MNKISLQERGKKMKTSKPTFAKEELKVAEFDFSKYLDSEEMIVGYLEECLDDPNPNVFLRALGHAAKARGMSELARTTGISRESLYKSFNGECKPQFATVLKITRAMGLNLSLTGEKASGKANPKKRTRQGQASRRRKREPVMV